MGPGQEARQVRAVLDTNVLISAMVFKGESHHLVATWRSGHLRLFASPAIVAEYVQVLHYPKFKLSEETIAGYLNDNLLPYLESAKPARGPLPFPCADPDDDKSLMAALGARADMLITGDTDLLVLNGKYHFKIVTPNQALHLLKTK